MAVVEGPPRCYRATLGVALIVLISLSLVLVGPTFAEKLGQTTGWGAPFEWTWLVLQWLLVFVLVATGIGLIYCFGPDADQDWVWITPGAVAATILWLLVSLLFKIYVANFTDYEGSYATVGGVIVVLLWFYVSGIAILTGAELNAEIEHAAPVPSRLIGVIEAEQTEEGERERNDRLLAVAANSAAHRSIHTLSDLSQDLVAQIENFFVVVQRAERQTSSK